MSTTNRTLTLEEFLRLPETEPASEYHEGRVIQRVSPQGKHIVLQKRWLQELDRVAEPSGAGTAFPEARCTFGGRSLVFDVAFVAWDRIPRDPSGEIADRFLLAPELVIEILSPRQAWRRAVEKLRFCVENGVQVAWLLDPKRKRALEARPGLPTETLAGGVLRADPVIPGAAFPLEEVFGWLIVKR